MGVTRYVALGDSMSTDHYPTCDVRDLDLPPARLDPLGAAALLYRNDDDHWPEFRGQDLAGHSPGVEFLNLAEDGAMIDDVRTEELARFGRDSNDPGIVLTITAGGNDLLDALTAGRQLDRAVSRIVRDYTDLIESVREELSRATIVLTTVYDPTDGTGALPGLEFYGPLPLEYLRHFNDHVRATARVTTGTALADVHRHFLGHGVTVPEAKRWYWRRNLIEPNARGASEIRRVWLEALSGITLGSRHVVQTAGRPETPERKP
jgi:lysophospholipase L1-like esterase